MPVNHDAWFVVGVQFDIYPYCHRCIHVANNSGGDFLRQVFKYISFKFKQLYCHVSMREKAAPCMPSSLAKVWFFYFKGSQLGTFCL